MDDSTNTPRKQCTKCLQILPATFDFFTHAKNGKYGFAAYCKKCAKKYQQEHKEKIAEQQRRYRQEHSEKLKQYDANRREKQKEYNKRYRQEHKEYFKERERIQ